MSALAAFRWAADGVLRTLSTERHLKIHWIAAMAVMIVGMGIRLEPWALGLLWTLTALVLAAELFNSAIEAAIDGVTRARTPWARDAKDAAAGAVLVLSVAAALALALVVRSHWAVVSSSADRVLHAVLFGLPVLAALAGRLFVRGSAALRTGLVAAAAAGLAALTATTADPGSAALGWGLLAAAGLSPPPPPPPREMA